jgi:hypothetical protein
MSFDEMYDELVHAEFLSDAVHDPARRGAHGPIRATFAASRLRSIMVITSGGLLFAGLGAFLGGLGGEFAVSPAGAHALTSSQRIEPLSAAPASSASHVAAPPAPSASPAGSGPVTSAPFGQVSDSTTSASGIASSSGGNGVSAPVPSTATGGGTTSGSSGGTGGSSGGSGGTTPVTTSPAPTSPVTQIVSGTGLSGVTSGLTQTITGVVGSTTVPGTDLSTVTDPLTGVVTSVTSGLLGG